MTMAAPEQSELTIVEDAPEILAARCGTVAATIEIGEAIQEKKTAVTRTCQFHWLRQRG